MSELSEFVKEFDGFPSLSDTVSQIIELYNKGDVDINVLEKALQNDPNLSIQVLRLANSPFFGISGKVKSIKDACMIMGLANVFNLVTAADVINSLNDSGFNLINSTGFWEHSISTGVAMTVILKKIKHDDPNAFLAGLLHDIGKLALDSYRPELYEKVILEQKKNKCSFLEAEKNICKFTHSELGGEIARQWNLNSNLVETISHHHDSGSSVSNVPVAALQLSDFLVKGLGISELYNNSISEFHSRCVAQLGLKLNDLYVLMDEIERSSKNNCLLDYVK